MKIGDQVKVRSWWNNNYVITAYTRCEPYSYYNQSTGEKLEEYVDIHYNDDTGEYRIATIKTKDIIYD